MADPPSRAVSGERTPPDPGREVVGPWSDQEGVLALTLICNSFRALISVCAALDRKTPATNVSKLLLGFMAHSGLSEVKPFAAVAPTGDKLMGVRIKLLRTCRISCRWCRCRCRCRCQVCIWTWHGMTS